ncbi:MULTISPECIES: FadR/GntR family transcriptional regulator [Streptomyces]|uniref:FadR family transcriptional regulator n=1 Tax=Streptomyces rhizosphaericus TaxID=114699 RepID=A0A6G4A9U6_9ACTN|nr:MULTISPECIES: FCD domain-containing protein [Streptomyces]NEW69267.1 FadR family transcriptional regulator [Streptomyces rhizosphaericus]
MRSADGEDPRSEHVRVPKAAEVVATRLRKSIVRGELGDGDHLPTEAALLTRFGVSRPTLREALRVLEAEALIEVRRGSRGGARVKPPDGEIAARCTAILLEYRRATLSDVFEAAATIESACVSSLARHRTVDDIAQLTEAIDREEEVVGLTASLKAQNEFHTLVVRLSGNVTLITLSEMVRRVIDTATTKVLEREGRSVRQIEARHKSDQTHRILLGYIKDSDPDAAAQLWSRHLRETSKYLRTILDTEDVLDLLD